MAETEEQVLTPGQRMAALGRNLDLQALEAPLGSDEDEDPRSPRATREMNERKSEANINWRPASHLPDPPAKPGWGHRWIRVSHNSAGSIDNANMAKAMREGWRPAPASEYPELTQILFGRSGNLDIVEFGGLVLCRISEELAKQRQAHFANKARRQLSSINARLRENAGNDDRLEFEAKSLTEVKRTAR